MVYNGVDVEDSVYLYPDEETCMVGRWDNGEMVEAREGAIDKVMLQLILLISYLFF